jgi:hypothetical protein
VREILYIQEERRVGNDNTVKWRGLSLQIPPSPLRAHFARATVRVHEYPYGHLAIFHGPAASSMAMRDEPLRGRTHGKVRA